MATVLDELLVRIGIQDDTGDGAGRVNRGLSGMAAGAGIAGAAVGAAFAVGIDSAMDISAAQTSLETQFDLTGAEAERAGDIAGDVFSAGFGDSVEDVAASVGAVNNSIGDLGDFTDAELTQMSKSAQALGKTFEVDVADATDAVGQLIKTGLVDDATEGFDLITKTMESVPASIRDDILPTLEEYSTQFRKVGLDGETAMGLLSQGLQAGARDADTVADAIKEFAIRAVDGSDASADAFVALGLDADDMTAKIGEGGKDAEEGLGLVLDKLREMEDPVAREAAAVGLFGTKAEDLGEALFALDPATAAAVTGMDDAGGSAQELTDKMEADPAQQMEAAMRTLQMTLGELLMPVLSRFGSFLQQNQGLIKALLIPALIALVAVFVVLTAATIAWSVALLANPVVLIILAIVALIAIIVLLIAKWDWVKAQLTRLWDFIKAKVESVWGAITDFFADVGERIGQIISDAIGFIKMVFLRFTPLGIIISNWGGITGWIATQWGRVKRTVSDAVARIGGFFSGMWDGITSGLRSALNGAISLINSAIGGINSLIRGANRVPGISIPQIPFIPFLADGGITTGPTLAVLGEGREQEAVLPLSRLDQMINTSTSAPSTGKVEQQRVLIGFQPGGDDLMAELLQRLIRIEFGGDVGGLNAEA